MRKPLIIAGIVLVLAGAAAATGLALAFGGGGDRDDSSARLQAVTPTIVGDGSAGGFFYLEPVPLVPGKYPWPLGSQAAQERGMAALNAEKGKPQFEGTVNGIRLWSSEHGYTDGSVKVVCGGGDYAEWRLVEKLVFTYLPPGTAAEGPQQEVLCADGSVAGAGQHFVVTDGPTFRIWYESGERAFANEATAKGVQAATVQGRPAVIVRPLTEEGFGRTWVVFATKNGMIQVDAIDMPLDQALKIAEGVRCETC